MNETKQAADFPEIEGYRYAFEYPGYHAYSKGNVVVAFEWDAHQLVIEATTTDGEFLNSVTVPCDDDSEIVPAIRQFLATWRADSEGAR